jgi:hypothetical protein
MEKAIEIVIIVIIALIVLLILLMIFGVIQGPGIEQIRQIFNISTFIDTIKRAIGMK